MAMRVFFGAFIETIEADVIEFDVDGNAYFYADTSREPVAVVSRSDFQASIQVSARTPKT